MTTKGERYFLPQFGTNLRQYLFDQQDPSNDNEIRNEINAATEEFMPNIKIKNINIKHYGDSNELNENNKYKITLSIDYRVLSGNFDFTDEVTLNM
jgi:phage baseplate assembly protein W